jgi:choline dehydrogenase-like flavoprotein
LDITPWKWSSAAQRSPVSKSALDALQHAIVVGSGFGGAVAVARLAQAGLRVAILERGQRWPRGHSPRNSTDLKAGWLWHVGGGLFDLRWLDRMLSVQAGGWGGGSLIYANVFARPSDETFRPHWPVSYSRAGLDRYFDRLPLSALTRLDASGNASAALGRQDRAE